MDKIHLIAFDNLLFMFYSTCNVAILNNLTMVDYWEHRMGLTYLKLRSFGIITFYNLVTLLAIDLPKLLQMATDCLQSST